MSLDFPASATALWAIYDSTGIRPEYLIPVLASESGLNPGVQNLQGYPYYGLNQISGSYLQARGIDPQAYLSWPASAQLSTVVKPYMEGEVAAFGPLRSGTRVYQANFLPATLKTATTLDSVIARQTHPCGGGHTGDVYCANPGLDYTHKGTITVGDLAHFVAKQAAQPYVQGAIAQTYARRPAESPRDPVYGEDFSPSATAGTPTWLLALGIVVVGGVATYLVVDRMPRSRRRR